MEFNITLVPDDRETGRIPCPACTDIASLIIDPTDIERVTLQIQIMEEAPDGPIPPALSCNHHAGSTAARMIETWTSQHVRNIHLINADASDPNNPDDPNNANGETRHTKITENLVFADLKGRDFSGQNLEFQQMDGADLSGANLSGANLSSARMNGVNLTGANLSGANLKGASLRDAQFRNADLTGVKLAWTEMTGAKLSGADLTGIDMFGANLSRADLSHASLENATLCQAKLERADLSGANLSGTNLLNANLKWANLKNANMKGTKLSGAEMTGTQFSDEVAQTRESLQGNQNCETAAFTVDIKLTELNTISKAMRDNQIDFDPVKSMVCNHPYMFVELVFTGESAGETVDHVNQWLEKAGRPERIRLEFGEMPPATRRDFLELINMHSSWNTDWNTGQKILAGVNEESWEKFTASHLEGIDQA